MSEETLIQLILNLDTRSRKAQLEVLDQFRKENPNQFSQKGFEILEAHYLSEAKRQSSIGQASKIKGLRKAKQETTKTANKDDHPHPFFERHTFSTNFKCSCGQNLNGMARFSWKRNGQFSNWCILPGCLEKDVAPEIASTTRSLASYRKYITNINSEPLKVVSNG